MHIGCVYSYKSFFGTIPRTRNSSFSSTFLAIEIMKRWESERVIQELPTDDIIVNIEIPRRERRKFEYVHSDREDKGRYRIDRILPWWKWPQGYPQAYGFIQDTIGPDGDPIDVLLLSTERIIQGVYKDHRLRVLGVLEMMDEGVVDNKILLVDDNPKNRFSQYRRVEDIPDIDKNRLAHFFGHYKDWQGKETQFLGWGDRSTGLQLIAQNRVVVTKQG